MYSSLAKSVLEEAAPGFRGIIKELGGRKWEKIYHFCGQVVAVFWQAITQFVCGKGRG
jgi:hypothetical protein